MTMIKVSEPFIDIHDAKRMYKSLLEGWVSSAGPDVHQFEKNCAKLVKKKFGISVANGSAALDVALKACNLKKGDEVIISDFTIVSNILPILRMQAKPVLVDCDPLEWNINLKEVENKITKKTKVIIAAHIYGFPIEIDKLKKICSKNKIILIEDAAEQLGQRYKGKIIGSFGDISTFSFYANKNITTGEGGMICTNSSQLAKSCSDIKNLCFGKKNRFNHYDMGWNYRMTNMQACLGLSQLKKLNFITKKKRKIGSLYYKILRKNKDIYIQPPENKYSKNIYWVVGIVIKKKINILKLIKWMKREGVECREFFWPMHNQDFLKKLNIKIKGKFPVSSYISKHGLYLPSYVGLPNRKVKEICDKLSLFLSHN